MKCIKGILWAVLLVTFGILFTEELLWGPDQDIRFTAANIHYGTMPFLYLVYLVQGILRNRSDRPGLIRFLVVYHVRNVVLFVLGWIVATIVIVIVSLSAEPSEHEFSGQGPLVTVHDP